MMVSLNYHLEIKPGMNLEFMQTIGSIIIELRNIEGCTGIDFKQDSHDKDRFSLLLNGNNQKFIDKLLSTEEYKFLEGAITVLCKPPSVEVTIGNKTIQIDPDKKRDISLKNQIISKLDNNHQFRD
jgi:quinol monooxygenase YgiN